MFGLRCPYLALSHNPNHQILTFLSRVRFLTTQLLTVYFDTVRKGVFLAMPPPQNKIRKTHSIRNKIYHFLHMNSNNFVFT